MPRQFTEEQKKETVLKVKELRAQGKTLRQACQDAQIAPSVLANWRTKYFGEENGRPMQYNPRLTRNSPTTLIQIPIESEQPKQESKKEVSVTIIKGSLEDISSLLERIK